MHEGTSSLRPQQPEINQLNDLYKQFFPEEAKESKAKSLFLKTDKKTGELVAEEKGGRWSRLGIRIEKTTHREGTSAYSFKTNAERMKQLFETVSKATLTPDEINKFKKLQNEYNAMIAHVSQKRKKRTDIINELKSTVEIDFETRKNKISTNLDNIISKHQNSKNSVLNSIAEVANSHKQKLESILEDTENLKPFEEWIENVIRKILEETEKAPAISQPTEAQSKPPTLEPAKVEEKPIELEALTKQREQVNDIMADLTQAAESVNDYLSELGTILSEESKGSLKTQTEEISKLVDDFEGNEDEYISQQDNLQKTLDEVNALHSTILDELKSKWDGIRSDIVELNKELDKEIPEFTEKKPKEIKDDFELLGMIKSHAKESTVKELETKHQFDELKNQTSALEQKVASLKEYQKELKPYISENAKLEEQIADFSARIEERENLSLEDFGNNKEKYLSQQESLPRELKDAKNSLLNDLEKTWDRVRSDIVKVNEELEKEIPTFNKKSNPQDVKDGFEKLEILKNLAEGSKVKELEITLTKQQHEEVTNQTSAREELARLKEYVTELGTYLKPETILELKEKTASFDAIIEERKNISLEDFEKDKMKYIAEQKNLGEELTSVEETLSSELENKWNEIRGNLLLANKGLETQIPQFNGELSPEEIKNEFKQLEQMQKAEVTKLELRNGLDEFKKKIEAKIEELQNDKTYSAECQRNSLIANLNIVNKFKEDLSDSTKIRDYLKNGSKIIDVITNLGAEIAELENNITNQKRSLLHTLEELTNAIEGDERLKRQYAAKLENLESQLQIIKLPESKRIREAKSSLEGIQEKIKDLEGKINEQSEKIHYALDSKSSAEKKEEYNKLKNSYEIIEKRKTEILEKAERILEDLVAGSELRDQIVNAQKEISMAALTPLPSREEATQEKTQEVQRQIDNLTADILNLSKLIKIADKEISQNREIRLEELNKSIRSLVERQELVLSAADEILKNPKLEETSDLRKEISRLRKELPITLRVEEGVKDIQDVQSKIQEQEKIISTLEKHIDSANLEIREKIELRELELAKQSLESAYAELEESLKAFNERKASVLENARDILKDPDLEKKRSILDKDRSELEKVKINLPDKERVELKELEETFKIIEREERKIGTLENSIKEAKGELAGIRDGREKEIKRLLNEVKSQTEQLSKEVTELSKKNKDVPGLLEKAANLKERLDSITKDQLQPMKEDLGREDQIAKQESLSSVLGATGTLSEIRIDLENAKANAQKHKELSEEFAALQDQLEKTGTKIDKDEKVLFKSFSEIQDKIKEQNSSLKKENTTEQLQDIESSQKEIREQIKNLNKDITKEVNARYASLSHEINEAKKRMENVITKYKEVAPQDKEIQLSYCSKVIEDLNSFLEKLELAKTNGQLSDMKDVSEDVESKILSIDVEEKELTKFLKGIKGERKAAFADLQKEVTDVLQRAEKMGLKDEVLEAKLSELGAIKKKKSPEWQKAYEELKSLQKSVTNAVEAKEQEYDEIVNGNLKILEDAKEIIGNSPLSDKEEYNEKLEQLIEIQNQYKKGRDLPFEDLNVAKIEVEGLVKVLKSKVEAEESRLKDDLNKVNEFISDTETKANDLYEKNKQLLINNSDNGELLRIRKETSELIESIAGLEVPDIGKDASKELSNLQEELGRLQNKLNNLNVDFENIQVELRGGDQKIQSLRKDLNEYRNRVNLLGNRMGTIIKNAEGLISGEGIVSHIRKVTGKGISDADQLNGIIDDVAEGAVTYEDASDAMKTGFEILELAENAVSELEKRAQVFVETHKAANTIEEAESRQAELRKCWKPFSENNDLKSVEESRNRFKMIEDLSWSFYKVKVPDIFDPKFEHKIAELSSILETFPEDITKGEIRSLKDLRLYMESDATQESIDGIEEELKENKGDEVIKGIQTNSQSILDFTIDLENRLFGLSVAWSTITGADLKVYAEIAQQLGIKVPTSLEKMRIKSQKNSDEFCNDFDKVLLYKKEFEEFKASLEVTKRRRDQYLRDAKQILSDRSSMYSEKVQPRERKYIEQLQTEINKRTFTVQEAKLLKENIGIRLGTNLADVTLERPIQEGLGPYLKK